MSTNLQMWTVITEKKNRLNLFQRYNQLSGTFKCNVFHWYSSLVALIPRTSRH